MRWLVLAVVVAPLLAFAEEDGGVDAGAAGPPWTLDLQPNPATKDFNFALHDQLSISATGEVAARIRKDYGTTQPGQFVTLVLNGVSLKALPYEVFEPDAGSNAVVVSFTLERDSTNDDNRNAWNALLANQRDYEMDVPVYLKVGTGLAQLVSSPKPMHFSVKTARGIKAVMLFAAGLILVLFIGLLFTDMLRDPDTTQYSLGKSQMAFWGILVFVSVIAVLAVTGTLERIPPQTLGLLGISGATGLSALLIGSAASGNGLQKLRTEQMVLRAKLRTPEKLTVDETKRLEVIGWQMSPRHFVRNVCDDGNGPSFHRVQVVVWTVLLGGVFLNSVAQVLSMPEFPESLLLLMGISNATYLGFKIPENAQPK